MNQVISHISQEQLGYVLKYLERFMTLSMEEANDLLHYCEIRQFDKKRILVQEGEIDNYLSMVLKGLVRKFARVGKREATMQLATEGHVIQSEISFLARQPSQVILETLEPTTLISIRHDKMEIALEKFPQGEQLGRLILSGMFVKKDELEYNRASKTVRELFFEYIEKHPHMLQRVPQKYLASYLNIKPETFSRLKRLVKNRKKNNHGQKLFFHP
jgi:CRP-like cAMP-binding protein